MESKKLLLVGERAFSIYPDGSIAYGCNVNRELSRVAENLDCDGNGRTQIAYHPDRKIWIVNHLSNVVFDNDSGDFEGKVESSCGNDLDKYEGNRLSDVYGIKSGSISLDYLRHMSPESLIKFSRGKHD